MTIKMVLTLVLDGRLGLVHYHLAHFAGFCSDVFTADPKDFLFWPVLGTRTAGVYILSQIIMFDSLAYFYHVPGRALIDFVDAVFLGDFTSA